MYLIVGLGNPDKKYEKTFHNMGFIAVGDAAEAFEAKFKKKECEASVAEAFVNGEKIIFARPLILKIIKAHFIILPHLH